MINNTQRDTMGGKGNGEKTKHPAAYIPRKVSQSIAKSHGIMRSQKVKKSITKSHGLTKYRKISRAYQKNSSLMRLSNSRSFCRVQQMCEDLMAVRT
ncbi:hypothetical protein M413DRAFT_124467 [Hebeloma cylindrosporum]|uniref:Uncharacterized protein n=1 Tax=Hebeloma cylindrosporum TaxID=76867 RepID=A0A0C2YP63_HEBCY|nr:hypothetical protein M413DRAFT_124467 [Hebeloma cylindrosporum h7]